MIFNIVSIFLVLQCSSLAALQDTFPYVYFKTEKARLCFKQDSRGSSMKMTATSCCKKTNQISFRNNNILIGIDLCFGGDIGDGKVPKIVYQTDDCAYFKASVDGFLKVSRTSSSHVYCVEEFLTGPKIRNYGASSPLYSFHTNGSCHANKSSSHKVAEIEKLLTGNDYTLTNDEGKLTLTEINKKPTPTKLVWYSNKELYAIINGGERCLFVDEKEKLNDLDGLDVKYDKDSKGCRGQTFEYRKDIKTFELFATNYCWFNDGSALKLRRCSGVVFPTMQEQLFEQTSSAVHLQSSSIKLYSTSLMNPHVPLSTMLQSPSSTASSKLPTKQPSSTPSDFPASTLSPSSSLSTAFSSSTLPITTSLAKSVTQTSSVVQPSLSSSVDLVSSSSPHRLQSFSSTAVQNSSSFKTSVPESRATSIASSYALNATRSSIHTQPLDISSVASLAKSQSRQTSYLNGRSSASSTVLISTLNVWPSTQLETVYHSLYLASPGQQCEDHCRNRKLHCSKKIDTGNMIDGFLENNATCTLKSAEKQWRNAFDPFYNTSTNACVGYLFVNRTVPCYLENFADVTVRRLCRCIAHAGDDNFGPWLPWSSCTATCNGGRQERKRECNEYPCNGPTSQVKECNTQSCPVHGGFSEWSSWSLCSKSCGGGFRSRSRFCDNPVPRNGGFDCFGIRSETAMCNVNYCPVDGGWTIWTEWSACDKPCNSGWYRRWRYCTNPAPLYGGRHCVGDSQEKRSCNPHVCPAENITAIDVRFDKVWKKEMNVTGTKEYQDFYKELRINVRVLYQDEVFNGTYLYCLINSLKKGSIVATFTLYFTGLDSFQMLLLQDAVESDRYIGKLKIVHSNNSFASALVPSASPVNLTLRAPEANMIIAEWKPVEAGHQNGNISGYILFYREKLLRAEPYQSIATTSPGVTLRGLSSYTEYAFRVLAYNSNGNGLASDAISIYTQESVPSAPPLNVQAAADSPFTVIVSWENLAQSQWNGLPVGLRLTCSDPQGRISNQSVVFPKTSAHLKNLHPLTTYLIDACAVTRKGAGPCQRVQATTLASPPTRAPNNLTIESLMSHNSLKVSWERLSSEYIYGDLTGYKVIYQLVKVGGQVVATSRKKTKVVHPSLTQVALNELQPNAQYSVSVLATNPHGDGKISMTITGDTCPCPEVIYTNYAASAPYIYRDTDGELKGLIANILNNMTSSVCGVCKRMPKSVLSFKSNGKNSWAEKRSINEMKTDIDDYSHVSFPIFGNSELHSYNGHQFVPLFPHPGVIFFIIDDTLASKIEGMIQNVLNTWPIFLINLLFIALSGFLIWIFDWQKNQDEIPHGFFTGVGNGFYWSYITMGTHGYGDITPKGVLARLYAVAWILIGIVNMGILTGALTTAMTVAQVYDSSMIYDVEVAAVRGSEAYRIALHRNGKVNKLNQYKTIEEVSSALRRREVRGALVDVYSAAMRSDLFKHPDIVAKKKIVYPNAYGLVLSGDMNNAASAFRDYMNANADTFLEDMRARADGLEVRKDAGETVAIFDPHSDVFQKTLLGLFIGFVFFFLIGALSNFYKTAKSKSCIASEPSPNVQRIRELCESSLLKFRDSFKENIGQLEQKQLDNRVKKMRALGKAAMRQRFEGCREQRRSLYIEATETVLESIASCRECRYKEAEEGTPTRSVNKSSHDTTL